MRTLVFLSYVSERRLSKRLYDGHREHCKTKVQKFKLLIFTYALSRAHDLLLLAVNSKTI